VTSNRRVPPVWLMGLSNASFGLYNGFVFFAMPQLLAARHVSEARIAGITAVAMSPYFWAVVFGPMLDVRFSRRWYATLFAALESVFVILAVMNLDHLAALECALVAGGVAAMLASTALGGWLSTVCPKKDENRLSAWYNIANVGAAGITAVLGGELVRHLPLWLAALLLGLVVFAPAALFLMIPAPGPDRRLAGESFSQFNREVLALLRRREVLIALLLFLSPCGSFTLSNMLGGLGNDFNASARMVSLSGGAGSFVPGILGCLLFPIIARWMPLRFLYLANGILGGLFTASLILLPHASWTFVLAFVGECLFQAVSFAILIGIVFETIGQNNPLAATTFTFLVAAANIPVTYMLLVDGRAYSFGGAAGSFAADAAISVAACLLVGLLLFRLRGKAFGSGVAAIEPLNAILQED
jgi:MFS transporter, PAT family, beta-lactamase induction signal transducer AmpG